jgi:uncharacterized PurR-regulated membrane protein YhhQ (DUF165 family)
MRITLRACLAFTLYIAAVVLANLLIEWFGIIDFAPGALQLEAPAAVLFVGVALVARDILHQAAGLIWVCGAIAIGTVLSAVLADPKIAFASGLAFVASELWDLIVYQGLRHRGWAVAALVSSYLAAVVDSVLFLALAYNGSMRFLPGQLVGKFVAITVFVLVASRLRPLWSPRPAPSVA